MKIGWERICKGGIWNDSINLFVRQFYEGVRMIILLKYVKAYYLHCEVGLEIDLKQMFYN